MQPGRDASPLECSGAFATLPVVRHAGISRQGHGLERAIVDESLH